MVCEHRKGGRRCEKHEKYSEKKINKDVMDKCTETEKNKGFIF